MNANLTKVVVGHALKGGGILKGTVGKKSQGSFGARGGVRISAALAMDACRAGVLVPSRWRYGWAGAIWPTRVSLPPETHGRAA